ncbi:MAG TPA: four helix bundle protein [Victivallales bacterium]|nr:four helix bundle protein [Victivallales bacterium]
MRTENIIQEKSYAFAVRIVKLSQYFSKDKKEYVLSRQLLKSGTSVGANVEEGIGGQSKSDFVSKMSIAYKEVRETSYWLRLMRDTGYLSKPEFDDIYTDADELCRIVSKILTSSKTSPNE